MKTPETREEHEVRRLRGAWGWSLTGLWIIFWWLRLEGEKQALLRTGCPKNFINNVTDTFLGDGEACKAIAGGHLFWGLTLALLTAPFAFMIAGHIAKLRFRQLESAEQRRTDRQEKDRQLVYESKLAVMGEKVQHEERTTRRTNARFELITRLGAVDDQLIVLADENDPERVKLITLNVAQSLRDIHAKFSDEETRAFYAQDRGVAQRVERSLAEMRKLGLETTRLYEDLASMFQPSNDTGDILAVSPVNG